MSDTTVAAAFLTALAQAGITLPPDQRDGAVADAVALYRQILLIRAVCPAGATLPLAFMPPGAA